MTRNQSPCQLVDILAEVPDFRKKKNLRHPLEAMLGVLVVGQLCNQTPITLGYLPYFVNHFGEGIDRKVRVSNGVLMLSISEGFQGVLVSGEIRNNLAGVPNYFVFTKIFLLDCLICLRVLATPSKCLQGRYT